MLDIAPSLITSDQLKGGSGITGQDVEDYLQARHSREAQIRLVQKSLCYLQKELVTWRIVRGRVVEVVVIYRN